MTLFFCQIKRVGFFIFVMLLEVIMLMSLEIGGLMFHFVDINFIKV